MSGGEAVPVGSAGMLGKCPKARGYGQAPLWPHVTTLSLCHGQSPLQNGGIVRTCPERFVWGSSEMGQ